MAWRQCANCNARIHMSRYVCPECGTRLDLDPFRPGEAERQARMRTMTIAGFVALVVLLGFYAYLLAT